MTKPGPDFYDNDSVFDIYMNSRKRLESPNVTIEQPVLWELIGSPLGLDVLDLGCGDARVAKDFKTKGTRSYLGIEGSRKMLKQAQVNLESGFSQVEACWLEKFEPKSASYDLVISSLALHYIENLHSIFEKVYRTLKPGGRFIFSMEHPVITSCNKSVGVSGLRESWIVDDYFDRGERRVQWMGDIVSKYHRTVEDYLDLVTSHAFVLQAFREAEPLEEHIQDRVLLKRRRRIPLFLILAMQKLPA